MLKLETLVFNPFQENTYLLYDEESHECAIIDPGMGTREEEQQLDEKISSLSLKPVMLLQTHLHLDHVFGASYVAKKWGLLPQAHKDDLFLIGQTSALATQFGMELNEDPPAPEHYLKEGDEITLGSEKLKVIHVPGHSPGGIVFYSDKNNMLIAGDVLFKGSIGRTDLPGGEHELLISGIKEKLLILPDKTRVYPGHGPSTTIGEERKTNPFLAF